MLDAVKCYVGGGGKENRHVEEEGCNFKYDRSHGDCKEEASFWSHTESTAIKPPRQFLSFSGPQFTHL